MIWTDFIKGVDLSLQRLPTGPEYFYLADGPAAVAAARGMMADWREEDRATGERFLKSFDREIARGQVQIFGRQVEHTAGYGEVGKRIFAWWQGSGWMS